MNKQKEQLQLTEAQAAKLAKKLEKVDATGLESLDDLSLSYLQATPGHVLQAAASRELYVRFQNRLIDETKEQISELQVSIDSESDAAKRRELEAQEKALKDKMRSNNVNAQEQGFSELLKSRGMGWDSDTHAIDPLIQKTTDKFNVDLKKSKKETK